MTDLMCWSFLDLLDASQFLIKELIHHCVEKFVINIIDYLFSNFFYHTISFNKVCRMPEYLLSDSFIYECVVECFTLYYAYRILLGKAIVVRVQLLCSRYDNLFLLAYAMQWKKCLLFKAPRV